MRPFNRKGQLTMFVILGLLILAGGVTFFYLRGETTAQPTRQEVLASESVPIEFDPVKVYVENCLREISVEGLKILGERGGFIDPVLNDLTPGYFPTESNSVRATTNLIRPYWYHMVSDNKCESDCDFESIPNNKLFLTKSDGSPSVEGQIEKYVDDHLNDCLSDFLQLKNQGYGISELDVPSSNVRILDNRVLVGLTYPIEATKVSTRTISQYATTIDLDFKSIFDMANLMITYESTLFIFENYVMELIGAFGRLDNKIPPTGDAIIKWGSITRWSKTQVERHIQYDLLNYLQALRVSQTADYVPYYFPNDPYSTGVFNGMTIPGDVTLSNLEVEFYYDSQNWKPYFDLNCDGDDCKPSSYATSAPIPIVSQLTQLLGYQTYNFYYDVSFPVMVTINDPNAIEFGDNGYDFDFLIEGNIRNNHPLKGNFLQVPTELQPVGIASSFCDLDKRRSGNITMRLTDSMTNDVVEGASIVYNCAGTQCYIGETDEDGELEAPFPICMNGMIMFEKEGYITNGRVITTEVDRRVNLNEIMDPIVRKRFKIKKVLKEKSFGRFLNERAQPDRPSSWEEPLNLSDVETATLTLTRKNTVDQVPFVVSAEFKGGQDYGEIDIAPGDYEVRIDLLYDDKFIIPERTVEIEDEDVTFDEVEIDGNFLNGGLYCDTTGAAFLSTTPNFQKDKTLVFKVISPNIPGMPESERRQTDLEEVGKVFEYEGYGIHCPQLTWAYGNE